MTSSVWLLRSKVHNTGNTGKKRKVKRTPVLTCYSWRTQWRREQKLASVASHERDLEERQQHQPSHQSIVSWGALKIVSKLLTFMLMAALRFSSNLTVAAQCKTTSTCQKEVKVKVESKQSCKERKQMTPVMWELLCPPHWGPSQEVQCLRALLLLSSWHCYPGATNNEWNMFSCQSS